MASIRFYIRKPDLVIMYVIFSRDNILRYSTGQKCLPENWSSKYQRATEGFGYLKVNERIQNLEDRTREIILSIQRAGENLDTESVKSKLLTYDGKVQKKPGSLIAYLDKLKEDFRHNGTEYYKIFGTCSTRLKDYGKTYGEPSFMDIDLDFHKQFKKYMHSRGHSMNYTSKMFKVIKIAMAAAEDEHIEVNQAYKSRKFKAEFEDVFNIYLTKKELLAIHNYKYDKELQKSADLFLVACITGLRWGDLSSLTKANVIDGCIVKDMQKVKGRVVIPIHPIVQTIFNRYQGFPESVTNQEFNRRLKEIAFLAKITEDVEVEKTSGGVRKKTLVKRYTLVKSHTARRTFATLAYLDGLPILSIMAMTGHSTITSFLKYLKIKEIEIAASMKDNKFFKTWEL